MIELQSSLSRKMFLSYFYDKRFCKIQILRSDRNLAQFSLTFMYLLFARIRIFVKNFNMSKVLSQKDYLKKYLSSDDKLKKKKKKSKDKSVKATT